MRVYKRGATWWVDAMVAGRRVRLSTGTGDERQAWKRAESIVADAADPIEGWTLARALERTVALVWDGTRGERTATMNAQVALDYFGASTLLSKVTTDRLDQYVVHLKDLGNSNATINRKLAALGKLMTVAKDRGHLKVKPKLPLQREGKGRLRWLTDDEETALLNALHQWEKHREWYLTAFLLDTGLRLSEAFRAQLGDGIVHVWETKADTPRSVPLTERAVHAWRMGWEGLTKASYQHTLRRAMAVAGIEDASAHTLRHTFASRLVQKGVNLAHIQALLGHKSITTTMRYAHISSDNLRDAVDVLEERPTPALRRVK